MEPQHVELLEKHMSALLPKLQKIIDESGLKDFSINRLHLQFGAGGCSPPGACPMGQNCPWVDAGGVIHYYCG